MIPFLENLNHWSWLILSVSLLVLEMLLPGAFFIWMAVGAAITGIVLWLQPAMAWEAQMLIFSIFSIVSVIGWRLYFKKHPQQPEIKGINDRGVKYAGRVLTLETAIKNGFGKVRMEDTIWIVKGEDQPAGTKVRITGMEGAVLITEKLDQQQPV